MPGILGSDFINLVFKLFLLTNITGISWWTVLLMEYHPTHLGINQLWFSLWPGAVRQQTFSRASVYPDLCLQYSVTRPQWVKTHRASNIHPNLTNIFDTIFDCYQCGDVFFLVINKSNYYEDIRSCILVVWYADMSWYEMEYIIYICLYILLLKMLS